MIERHKDTLEFFIAPGSSGEADGTQDRPFASLVEALTALDAMGDTLLSRWDGTGRGALEIVCIGFPGEPFRLKKRPQRTFYVDVQASSDGNGSELAPWSDRHLAVSGLLRLVEAGELNVASAEHVQLIFDEAAYHIERSMGTCYEAMPMPDYVPAARGQVMQQTDLLAEMAEKGDLDPQTVAQAQAALERDVAFLNLSEEEKRAFYTELAAAGPAYPPFDEIDLEVTPEAAEAAAFLAQLLSGQ